ncbi:hypothetical protein FJY68_06405 [candidate division WOR-3 bacterium]|uniref:Uncharacterized protein n=1 Tax=candidate division WOR-3 bacterium TaxID=2052148 RepID=A0A938BRB9_UNCW3|nr:hypothetical protein [candidate division WOR-3 bacterium]
MLPNAVPSDYRGNGRHVEVYRYAARDGRGQCSLLITELPCWPRGFVATVLYLRETELGTRELTTKTLPIQPDVRTARNEAESWIRSNLFSHFDIYGSRERRRRG